MPTIDVTFDRLKRLPARSNGGVLYADVENIALNAYANTDGRQKIMTMREGDDVALNLPSIRLNAGTFDQLVVIGNVDQPPSNPKESSFATWPKSANYGPGTHVLQIPKWYLRLDPTTHKPIWLTIPAYEMGYTVRYLNPRLEVIQDPTSSVKPPKTVRPFGDKVIQKRKP